MKAIERVEELLSRLTGAASRVSGVVVDVSDLRAVLELAKEAVELKRRVRSLTSSKPPIPPPAPRKRASKRRVA